jgi:type I restriction enzyme S subunit
MVIKEGYKQTDSGIIPEDWKISSLNDCLELLTDFEANGSFESVADNVNIYDNENYSWYVRATDLEKNSELSNVKFVDESTYNFLKKTSLKGGEVLITKRGEIGKVYFFQMKTKYATVAPNMYLLNLNKSVVPFYIYSFFKAEIGNKLLKEKNASSTLGALYKDDVKSIQIPLPPTLAEQTAIATALSDADGLITGLEKLIAKKRNIKQGAMQQLLQPKEGWEVKKLGEIFTITAGGDLDVNNFSLITDEKYCYPIYSNALTNKGLYGFTSEYRQIENTITVTARGQVGVANPRDHKYTAIGRVIMLNPIIELNINFITECINNFIKFNNESTGVPQLTAPQISKYEIIIPDYKEQIHIATILSDMDAELSALEQKLEKYKKVKLGMMQELLTGKTRLV